MGTKQPNEKININDDPTATQRKQDHIELAFRAQVASAQRDTRFLYEPLLSAHPKADTLAPVPFLGKTLRAPMWVSSMTGGTAKAKIINQNLARACREFGMGMGLGSCRGLLNSNDFLADFDVRHLIGDELPLYANLGIAQVEKLLINNNLYQITDLIDKLKADGLIIHINPLQEWLQPEGDTIHHPPIETIATLLAKTNLNIIVKEVGQGMASESLEALMRLPLQAIDFAAFGGTNFSILEFLRHNKPQQKDVSLLGLVGHTAEEMIEMVNTLLVTLGSQVRCQQFIISGGIKNFLDGYYAIHKLNANAIYGQASAFLEHAQNDYETLHEYIVGQVKGLTLAQCFLRIK